jgi:predicted ferric reductase
MNENAGAAVTSRPDRTQDTSRRTLARENKRRGWRAASWIAAFFVLVSAPLVVLLLGEMPEPIAFWWDFSMGLGFAGLSIIGIQFALTARFRRLSSPFGLDVIFVFHRYLAWAGLGLVATHFAILWFLYEDALGVLDPREARWELTAGRAALLLFAAAVITSEWRQLLRLEYGLWRYSHAVFATLGFAVAIAHVLGVGNYTATPSKAALWLILTACWVVLILWIRLGKPWARARRPYRVTDVEAEPGEAWTLSLEPVGHDGFPAFKPGQFAWLTLRHGPFSLREHPFSLVSAPEERPRLSFGIKALGDFTRTIGNVRPGETAYLDGPYGVFSTDFHPEAEGYVFVVGGIGVTPVMSMLHSLALRGERRSLWLFYANNSWEDVIYAREIERLTAALDLTVVHILNDPPAFWKGEEGYLTQETLEKHLPTDSGRLCCFLCGPEPMTAAAREALEALGVPADSIRSEVFELT